MLKLLLPFLAIVAVAPGMQRGSTATTTAGSTTAKTTTTGAATTITTVQLPSGAVTVMTTPADGPAGQAAVAARTFKVPADRNVAALLAANGIEPTADAIAVVYDLNPAIDDIKLIPAGSPFVLPVRAPALVGRPGAQVRIHNAQASREAIAASKVELEQLSRRAADVQADRFRNAADRSTFVDSVTRGKAAIDQTMSGEYPLAQKVLEQTALNARILRRVASSVLAARSTSPETPGDADGTIAQQVSPAEINQVQEAAAGQQAIAADLKAGGSGLGLVQVITLDLAGQPRKNLRVQYAPKLDLTSINAFKELTSPVAETLVVGADFTLWTDDVKERITLRVAKQNNTVVLQIVK